MTNYRQTRSGNFVVGSSDGRRGGISSTYVGPSTAALLDSRTAARIAAQDAAPEPTPEAPKKPGETPAQIAARKKAKKEASKAASNKQPRSSATPPGRRR
jgi:hypothetical protein